MAVKPWIGALVAPSEEPEVVMEKPEQNLELEYVLGYRCEDSRQNVYFQANSDKLVYMTAALGIVLDVPSNTQKFFGTGLANEAKGHNDDITALAICPNRQLVATGQRGKKPFILIWDSETNEIKAQCSLGRNKRAVKTVKFSKCGKYVFATDEHNDHNVYVFDAESGQKLGEEKTGGDPIMDMDTGSGSFQCAVAGKRGLQFFTFSNYLEKHRGMFGGQRMKDMISIAFLQGDKALSGTVDGQIYMWNGNKASKAIKAHKGAIHAITYAEGQVYSTGRSDKVLKIWDENLNEQNTVDVGHYARAIDAKDGKVVCGLRDGRIVQVADGTVTTVMQGFATGEAWGLTIDA